MYVTPRIRSLAPRSLSRRLLLTPAVLATLATFAMAACGDDGNAPPPPTGSVAITVAPASLPITQGQTGTLTVTLARTAPFAGPVDLTIESAQAGITGAFAPATIPAAATTSAVTVSVVGTVAPGDYPVTVRAKATGLTDATATATITVAAAQVPAFSLAATPRTLRITQGDTATSLLTVMRAGGFTGTVTLDVTGAPAGVTATVGTPALTGDTTSVRFAVAPTAAPATFSALVTGTATGLTARTDTIAVTIAAAASYALSLTPDSLSVVQGQNGQGMVRLARDSGFTAAVTLTIDSLPAGITTALGQSTLTGDSTALTLSIGGAVAPGLYPVVVRGNTPNRAEKVDTLRLTVVAAPAGAIAITVVPGSIGSEQGRDTTFRVIIARSNFTDTVRVAVAGVPGGASASAAPTSGDTAVVTLTVPDTTAIGSYALLITASGTNVPDATAQLNWTLTQKPVTSGNVQWQFCGNASERPVWVAAQDGGGAWRTLGSLANDTYAFSVATIGGIAYVTQNAANDFDLTLTYGTAAELTALGASCNVGGTPKSIPGTIVGVAPAFRSAVSFGGALTSVVAPNTNFTLTGVPAGALDLVASRLNATTGTSSGLILRRGLNLADGVALDTLNFDGPETVQPESRNVTVVNGNGEPVTLTTGYFTLANSFAELAFDPAGTAATRPYPRVPTFNRRNGDLHVLGATALEQSAGSTIASRSVTAWLADPQDPTLTLGSALGTPDVSVASGAAYARLRLLLVRQAEYNHRYLATFSQGGAAPRQVTLTVSAGYLGSATDLDVTMPIFSTFAGWQNIWGLQPGTLVSWNVAATGWTGGGATPPRADGTIVSTAWRVGQVQP